MPHAGDERGRGSGGRTTDLAPVSPVLLDEPLEYLLAYHLRQRCLCAALRRIASVGRIDHALSQCIATRLGLELAQHHEDEDRDFFPAVLRRSLPEDDLAPIIAQLTEDHRRSSLLAGLIAEELALSTPETTLVLDAGSTAIMRAYAERETRHLAIENAIVMVIARKRLKLDDLRGISRRMKTRRGVST